MEKQDFFGECNSLRVPLGDFEQAFCNYCLQQECVRSQHGKSLFEKRTSSWYERLFENPARMSPDDPRMGQIQAKRFLDVLQDTPYEIGRGRSEWLDPRDLTPPPAPSPPPAPPPAVVEESAPDTDPTPPLVIEKEEKAVSPEPLPVAAPAATNPRNTTFTPGKMIGGRETSPAKQPRPVYDPWAGNEQPRQEGETRIVKPGAKIKLT